ncbi:hypothetical protein SAMN04487905_11591 [Actinopolyspora xinjiangensis]|uniref:Enoyl-(Acyl carrier protein) reductase n=1 Tax=Actinopolyspora xinjiangensis TaxID=405564 RepID=A0A1H0WU44_9ACTN|nr:hypothetical protein SAMN04487905_11591 [Actinopolyspora xinjiangensis]
MPGVVGITTSETDDSPEVDPHSKRPSAPLDLCRPGLGVRAQRQHVDDEPLVTTAEVVHAMEFLLTNTGINAQDLHLDGGVTPT